MGRKGGEGIWKGEKGFGRGGEWDGKVQPAGRSTCLLEIFDRKKRGGGGGAAGSHEICSSKRVRREGAGNTAKNCSYVIY